MQELHTHLLHSPVGKAWKRIGISPHHGINLPLSALHSKHSCGIGEFYDLIPLIDWCKQLKMDLIQLLPLNNSEGDPSPYNAISSCAINFAYLSLHELPHLDNLPALKEQLVKLRELTAETQVCYLDVQTHKLSWLHQYIDEVGEQIAKTKHFSAFVDSNLWVKPYALYKSIKERLGNTPSSNWPLELQAPFSPDLYALYQKECQFHEIQQYLCYLQLKAIKEYANEKGVFLMGDIPIMISRESVDVWQYPAYFDLSYSAGAPPDYYNPAGQNWGFPIFQWEALRKNHFDWWKQRLTYAENFYDLVRIDHVVGFFRIWAISSGQDPKNGIFLPERVADWFIQGRELLEMIANATSMLPIAEDLGTIPDDVRPLLFDLGICSTKVIRWERRWKEDQTYIPLEYYPPVSLTTLSTHDSETTSHWWKKFPEEAQAFAQYKNWEYSPEITQEQLQEILWDSHHTSSLLHINLLQEYLAQFPELVHNSPDEERINIPGIILPSNWTYRFKPSVEEFTSHAGLFASMEKILLSPTPRPDTNI